MTNKETIQKVNKLTKSIADKVGAIPNVNEPVYINDEEGELAELLNEVVSSVLKDLGSTNSGFLIIQNEVKKDVQVPETYLPRFLFLLRQTYRDLTNQTRDLTQAGSNVSAKAS